MLFRKKERQLKRKEKIKLALGTAQFGLSYGVANETGKVECSEVTAILRRACLNGVDTLDTAITYGDSEKCLGEAGVDGWRVVSKLPELPENCIDVTAWVNDQVLGSLSRLKIRCFAGFLLHRPSQLLGKNGKALWAALQNLKHDSIVEKIGFSIYDPSELDVLWPNFPPDLVQAPYNILDRRLEGSGWLKRMDEAGVEVHVRSVFLQGLLLMDKSSRPKKFDRWVDLWSVWDAWLAEYGQTALHACLAFVLSEPRISRVIVGVDGLSQLKEILLTTDDAVKELVPDISLNDVDLIDPSRWGTL